MKQLNAVKKTIALSLALALLLEAPGLRAYAALADMVPKVETGVDPVRMGDMGIEVNPNSMIDMGSIESEDFIDRTGAINADLKKEEALHPEFKVGQSASQEAPPLSSAFQSGPTSLKEQSKSSERPTATLWNRMRANAGALTSAIKTKAPSKISSVLNTIFGEGNHNGLSPAFAPVGDSAKNTGAIEAGEAALSGIALSPANTQTLRTSESAIPASAATDGDKDMGVVGDMAALRDLTEMAKKSTQETRSLYNTLAVDAGDSVHQISVEGLADGSYNVVIERVNKTPFQSLNIRIENEDSGKILNALEMAGDSAPTKHLSPQEALSAANQEIGYLENHKNELKVPQAPTFRSRNKLTDAKFSLPIVGRKNKDATLISSRALIQIYSRKLAALAIGAIASVGLFIYLAVTPLDKLLWIGPTGMFVYIGLGALAGGFLGQLLGRGIGRLIFGPQSRISFWIGLAIGVGAAYYGGLFAFLRVFTT